MLFILFYLCVLLTTLGKAISDIVSDETNWKRSIFFRYKIDSYFGCKDNTYHRKYKPIQLKSNVGISKYINQFIAFSYRTLFVFLSDIWHLGNTISRGGYYFALLFAFMIGYSYGINIIHALLLVCGFAAINIFGFHFFYHWGLRSKSFRRLL